MASRIFVLEDDAILRDLYKDILAEEEGYDVVDRADLVPLEEVERIAPDVIVLDCNFGSSNCGLSFLRQVKARPATAHIPIILSTGASWVVRDMECQLRSWQVGILLKPFAVDDLVTMVRQALEPLPSS